MYADGYSLYAAYFVPNLLDPTGNGASLSFDPKSPENAPWRWEDLGKGTAGHTLWNRSVDCECIECDDTEGCGKKVKCDINVSAKIVLNTEMERSGGARKWNGQYYDYNATGTYGHEQLHIKNINAAIKEMVDAYSLAFDTCDLYCDSDVWETTLKSDIDRIIELEQKHSGIPAKDGLYDPMGGKFPPPENPSRNPLR